MIRRPSLAGALAVALGCLGPTAGCTSPETASEPMVTGIAACALTYANGDTKEGTVTVASLPLLSYYTFREDPKTHERRSRLCWLPVLGSLESESRDIRGVVATLAAPPSCPDEEPPPPPAPKKGRIVIRTTDDDELAPPPPARATPPPVRAVRPATPTAAPTSSATPAPETPSRTEPLSAPVRDRPTSTASPAPRDLGPPREVSPPARRAPSNGARIISAEPSTRTEVDFVFPLFHIGRERPGTAVIQRPGRTKSVVEVGDSKDDVRALPLFSYRRDPERERLILWPLLASGFDDDAEGKHLVLFYFLRIRTGDPEKP